jgi:hypothetical protein
MDGLRMLWNLMIEHLKIALLQDGFMIWSFEFAGMPEKFMMR